ncbi:MAG: DUF2007 domain-containing protein [Chthoniobacteraceae bacterium]
MKDIFVHADLTQLAHCQSILEEAGIATVIRNEATSDLIVGLPDPLRQPVLCVTNDADAERARELLRDIESAGKSNAPEWKCPQCGETVPGNFGSCWKCDALRPAAE